MLMAITAFFQPIDMVLHQNSYGYRLASFSELTSTVHIGNERQQTCCVDRSWAFQKGQMWVKFALVEFKRRGALEERDCSSSAPGSKVTGRGGKICRQLKKYAHLCRTRFVACCDGEKLVLMILGGNSEDWYRDAAYTAPTTPAQARWVGTPGEMKRHLFVFLREALVSKLRENGMLV